MWRRAILRPPRSPRAIPKWASSSIEVARPDFPVADRSKFADTDLKAAAKGLYVIRDFAPDQPRHGYVIAQGSSSTVNLVKQLAAAGRGRDQCEGDLRDQRRAVRPPAGGLSQLGAAAGSAITT